MPSISMGYHSKLLRMIKNYNKNLIKFNNLYQTSKIFKID
jgi:hypothetical protein